MKATPLVTINIPTYNQEKYIRRAIESCLRQDYSNLEIIVSDDCSTDNTFEIARQLTSEKLSVFRTSRNLGRVKNYHHLLYQLAKGEWVVNLDGDDYYNDATFISEAICQLQANADCVMYVAGASTLNEKTGKVAPAPIFLKKDISILKGTDYVLNFYKYGQIGQHFSIVYNRGLALETDFYTLDSLGADTDSICRLALKGRVLVQKKWVGVWTSHSANASYTLNTEAVQKELDMLKHIAEAAKKHLPSAAVDKWLSDSQRIKFKQSLFATLPSLPPKQALWQLLKHWSWQLQDFKEVVKIGLRSLLK